MRRGSCRAGRGLITMASALARRTRRGPLKPIPGDHFRLIDGSLWRVVDSEREDRTVWVRMVSLSSSTRMIRRIELAKLLVQVDGWSPAC